jgi:hypothetical protein
MCPGPYGVEGHVVQSSDTKPGPEGAYTAALEVNTKCCTRSVTALSRSDWLAAVLLRWYIRGRGLTLVRSSRQRSEGCCGRRGRIGAFSPVRHLQRNPRRRSRADRLPNESRLPIFLRPCFSRQVRSGAARSFGGTSSRESLSPDLNRSSKGIQGQYRAARAQHLHLLAESFRRH